MHTLFLSDDIGQYGPREGVSHHHFSMIRVILVSILVITIIILVTSHSRSTYLCIVLVSHHLELLFQLIFSMKYSL